MSQVKFNKLLPILNIYIYNPLNINFYRNIIRKVPQFLNFNITEAKIIKLQKKLLIIGSI